MLDAAQFQRSLSKAMRGGPASGPFAAPGFAVYRNTWVKALLDALAANYPVVAALLGSELFQGVAVEYVKSHPARSPVLALYGRTFPVYLARRPLASELPYLADVARLERLWTECLFAPEAEPLALDHFSDMSWDDALALRPMLHPAVRLGGFDTPAVTIWAAHKQGDFDELEPDWRPERAIVGRAGNSVQVRQVPSPEFALLTQFQRGRSIGDALERVVARHPGADLAPVLASTISSGILTLAATDEKER